MNNGKQAQLIVFNYLSIKLEINQYYNINLINKLNSLKPIGTFILNKSAGRVPHWHGKEKLVQWTAYLISD